MNQQAASITELNAYIKTILDSDEALQNVYVTGEVSNFKRQCSGHLYFSLKDEKCGIKCMMFAYYTGNINFELKNGIKVFAYGNVSCYEPMGQYQLYVYHVVPAGIGEINESLKKLYNKLKLEGLFDESKKKKLKRFPKKIGVVTSRTGAVIYDISSVLKRRFPIAEIVLASVKVQGIGSVDEILSALDLIEKTDGVDAVIIARGGGSLEDLWAFNDEKIVRKIASCQIPTISAVGHDTDYTLCDYAADVRAATPSVAAELASDSVENILSVIDNFRNSIKSILENKILNISSALKTLRLSLNSELILKKIEKKKLNVYMAKREINIYFSNSLNKKKLDLEYLKNKIRFFNPKNIFKMGYSIFRINGGIITSLDDINEGDVASVSFADGVVKFNVFGIKKEKENEKNNI